MKRCIIALTLCAIMGCTHAKVNDAQRSIAATQPASWHQQIEPSPLSELQGDDILVNIERLKPLGSYSAKELPTREQAFTYLLNTNTLCSTFVGYDGGPPAALFAFGVLMDQPDRTAIFDDLVSRARVGGVAYGIMGLSLCDPRKAETRVAELLKSDQVIYTQSGCTGGQTKLSDVLKKEGIPSITAQKYMEVFRTPMKEDR